MRRHHLLLALLSLPLAACGEANKPRVTLPVVAARGDVPSGPWVVNVRITEGGDIYIEDGERPVNLVELATLLREKQAAFGPDGRFPSDAPERGSSRMDLVFEADANALWAVAGWVMQVASDPWIAAHRYYFRVRCGEEHEGGAFACFGLPDASISDSGPYPDFDKVVPVTLRVGDEASSLRLLRTILAINPEGYLLRALTQVNLDGPGIESVTVQSILAVMDVLLRVHAHQFTPLPTFPPPYKHHLAPTGSPTRTGRDDLLARQRAWVADHAIATAPVVVLLCGEPVPPSSRPYAPPCLRQPGTYGLTLDMVFHTEPILDMPDGEIDPADLPVEESLGSD